MVGREEETKRVLQILAWRIKSNPALIGEPGVDKTAIVEGLAEKMARGYVPKVLKDKTLIALDSARSSLARSSGASSRNA